MLILGALSSLVTLAIMGYVLGRASSIVDEAGTAVSGMLDDYAENTLLPMMDDYVETRLLPGMKEKMFGHLFAQMPPATTSGGDGGDVVASDESRRRRGSCPSRNAGLCTAASAACRDLVTCRAHRTETVCTRFALEVNDVCVRNDCDQYTDKNMCNRLTALCTDRMRCFFNATACVSLESELLGWCRALG